jgi:phage-related minor tail protein
MLDDLAASMYRKTYLDVEVRGPGITGPAYEAPTIAGGMAGGSTATPAILTSTPVPAAAGNFYGGIRLFADGGIATRPTPGIFGEAGPEALIPLDRMGDFGGGNTYNINVNAGVGDPRAIGKSVVEAITLFERSSGPVFARA